MTDEHEQEEAAWMSAILEGMELDGSLVSSDGKNFGLTAYGRGQAEAIIGLLCQNKEDPEGEDWVRFNLGYAKAVADGKFGSGKKFYEDIKSNSVHKP